VLAGMVFAWSTAHTKYSGGSFNIGGKNMDRHPLRVVAIV
jgi:hypothetical protein